MSAHPRATSVLSVRVNPSERALLEAAAAEKRTSLSEFMRRIVLEAAENALFSRSVVTISAEHWEAFENWLHRPAEDNPGLAEITKRTPQWEQ